MMLVLRQLSAYISSRGICTGKLTGQFYVLVARVCTGKLTGGICTGKLTGQFYVLVARVCKIDISFLELNLNVAQPPPNLYVAEDI